MKTGYKVTLSYPTMEAAIEGWKPTQHWRTEQWHHADYPAAKDAYNAAVFRLHTLGDFAQVDLIDLASGNVIRSQANVPPLPPGVEQIGPKRL